MWNPVKIEFCNLFSHKHSQYEFKNGKCVVIFGDNKDDKSLQNNGSGKTTLFEAVCIALTNESLRGLKKESFINREADDCKIIFCLENSAMKMKLRIERQFFRGSKPAKIAIYENGELNSQIVSVNEANKRVLELIGISREDLLRYFIISQDNHYTFFTASDSEKKEIMNRITSADMVNPVIEQLDLKFKEKDAEYKQINDEIGKLSDKRELLEEQKKEVLANDNTVYEIKRIMESKETAEEVIRDKKNDIANYKKRIAELDKELSDIVLTDVTELVKKKKKIQSECDDLESELLNNKKLLKKLKNELGLTITCPHCQKEFIPESQLNLSPEEIREAIGQLNKETSDLSSKLEKREKSLEKVKKDILRAEEQKEEMDNLSYEKNKQQRRINNAQETIKEMQDSIDIYDKQIAELKRKKKDNKLLNSLNERIADCGKQIDELVNRLQPIADEIDMIKFWQFNMGKHGFMTFLANKTIFHLNWYINFFLEKMNINYKVLIKPFKILKTGEVRDKIECFVTNNGLDCGNYLSFSGGERQRINLATILSLQKMINNSTNTGGLNLLCFDESFNNIDYVGTMSIVDIMNKMDSTILLITQNIEDCTIFDDYVMIQKENGISKILI